MSSCSISTARIPRDTASRSAPLPTMSTRIASGVWKTTSWNDVGSRLVRTASPSTTATTTRATMATSRQPGWRPDGLGSATVRLGRDPDRSDEDLARVRDTAAGREPRLRPMEGDREVGADGGLGRLAAREVDRRRGVDGHHRDAAGPGLDDELDRRADRISQRPAHPGAEQRVDDDRRLVDPGPEDRDVTGVRQVDLADPLVAGDAVPVPGADRTRRAGLRRHETDDDRGARERESAGSHEPVAAVVAGAAEDHDGTGSPSVEVDRQRPHRRRH